MSEVSFAVSSIMGDPALGLTFIGMIIPWYGVAAQCPEGWAIADGTVVLPAGTPPDLRDRVIVGAGTTYALGATGGATSNSLTHTGASISAHAGANVSAHANGAVADHSAHTHQVTSFSSTGVTAGANFNTINVGSTVTTGNPNATLTHSVTQPDAHSITQANDHTFTEPGAHSASTLQPYAALYLIVRVR